MKRFETFAEYFLALEQNDNNATALNYRSTNGEYKPFSSKEICHQIECITLALNDLGLKPGDKVGILAKPSPYWTVADLSTMLLRLVNVPMFPNVSEKNFLYEVELTEQKVIFVGGAEPWKLVDKHRDKFEAIIALDKPPSSVSALSWEDLIAKGEEILHEEPNRFYSLLDQVKPEDPATIIFTSGTTGLPKGAVHTHKSLGANNRFNSFGWQPNKDVYLNILPLAHIFGRVLNYVLLYYNVSIYYLNDLLAFRDICLKVRPTVLVIVPRLLEKLFAGINNKIKQATGVKKWLASTAIALAADQNPPFYKKMFFPLFDKLVYHKFREILGGRVRIVISGGAPLDPMLGHFFNNVGIPTYEGWGMTESNIGATNFPGHQKIGTVGKGLFPDVELKVENGEIKYRCLSQMIEYYKNPEATAETIDPDGWIATGDKGSVDSDGYLTIERRIKELYKTSSGEYIAPLPIESELRKHDLVDMAMLVGDGEKFATCLLFPDLNAVNQLKKDLGQESISLDEFLQSESVRKSIQEHLQALNQHLQPWEKVRRFHFLPRAPSIEHGELTPTMKLCREKVIEKYSDIIRDFYI